MTSVFSQTVKHIAFIMDGNRRWAKSNIFGNFIGYKKGMENMLEKAQLCIENKIPFATFFALSVENLTRDKEELGDLFLALKTIYNEKKPQIEKNKNFKLKIIGNLHLLSPENRKFLENTEKEINANKTEIKNEYTTIIIAIAYSGREEIIQACNKIAIQKSKRNCTFAKKYFQS
jgi:undecaprenyl diphosphate synthase